MDAVTLNKPYRLEDTSALRKALDASTGAALSPQNIEKAITEIVVKLRPEMAMIESVACPALYKDFNQRTALPTANGAMGDGATTPTSNGTYVRKSIPLKVVRRKGAVTNFLRDSTKTLVDAAAVEMEGHVMSHVLDLTTLMLHGNAGADAFQFDGWDKFITTNRTESAYKGTTVTDLKFMDTMIDANTSKQGASHRKAFLMSPYMKSKASQLLTNVRLVQGLTGGMSQVEIPGGWRLDAYRNVPILETSTTRPNVLMGALTADAQGAGSLATDNYFIQVSAVTWEGESLASTEIDYVIASTTGSIKFHWTAVAGAFSYKIYLGMTTGAEKLIKVLPARAYDGAGTPGAAVTSVELLSVAVDTATVTTAMGNDLPKVQETAHDVPEDVYLIDLDIIQGMGELAYSNGDGSRFQNLVSVIPLAQTDDNVPFLVKTYCAIVPSFEATSSVVRGLRTF